MVEPEVLTAGAALFRALGSQARLGIVQVLTEGPMSVSYLVARTEMPQPLVSQHLRVLRSVGVVTVQQHGRERIYRLADEHVHHIVEDTLVHVREHIHPEG